MLQSFTDQMGQTIKINYPPKRIVSLVPSQTELLFDLGLEKEVVGITRFCIHPKKQYQVKTRVGGTKDFTLARIQALQPDLIIGNKEENYKAGIEQLQAHYPVWMSDIYTLADAYNMINGIGVLVGKQQAAASLVVNISSAFVHLKQPITPKQKVAYFIWRKPYMVAGKNTFIDEMIRLGGWQNVFGDTVRYPSISLSDLVAKNPAIVFLSSEPYPFKEAHMEELKKHLPNAQILLVDGELFSWYGSRLLKAASYLEKLRLQLN